MCSNHNKHLEWWFASVVAAGAVITGCSSTDESAPSVQSPNGAAGGAAGSQVTPATAAGREPSGTGAGSGGASPAAGAIAGAEGNVAPSGLAGSPGVDGNAMAGDIASDAGAVATGTGRLEPSPNGRFLQWTDGTPIFLLSDTAWLLPGSYSLAEVEAHVATRASQGFTAIQMTASFPENDRQPLDEVFIGADFMRPVEAYWESLDEKIRVITGAGLIALVNPIWKKTADATIDSNGPAKCRAYGLWLASRYRDNPRVAYFVGGDDTPAAVREELDAMGLGIQDAYTEAGLPPAIVAYHGDPARTSREEWPNNPSWLTLDWSYAYSEPLGAPVPYQENHLDWPKNPPMPIMFGEGWYDQDDGASQTSRFANRAMLRRQAWWNPLSGALAGYAYGAEPIWLHRHRGNTPAHAAAWNSGRDAARMKQFLDTVEWWRLQPDLDQSFITAGNAASGSVAFAVGALADDDSFGLVYTPEDHDLTLRMPAGRDYTLRWFDPSDGTYRDGSVAGASGASVVMSHPGTNASNAADWVIHVASP